MVEAPSPTSGTGFAIAAQLGATLNGALFDVASVRWDSGAGLVSMNVALDAELIRQPARVPLCPRWIRRLEIHRLRVTGARDCTVNDRARIGWVEIGAVAYDHPRRELQISACEPATCIIGGDGLVAELAPSGALISRTVTMLLGFIEIRGRICESAAPRQERPGRLAR